LRNQAALYLLTICRCAFIRCHDQFLLRRRICSSSTDVYAKCHHSRAWP
jgi:hypothetical protein